MRSTEGRIVVSIMVSIGLVHSYTNGELKIREDRITSIMVSFRLLPRINAFSLYQKAEITLTFNDMLRMKLTFLTPYTRKLRRT